MQAKELMSQEPRSVRTIDRLDAAARVLWEQDCGIVPVVDGAGVLVGVITDRDLCMASYTQGRPLAEIPVAATMARAVRTCRPDDTLATVMATLQQAQVHRLPVVDARGVLVGIVSTNDLVRAANSRPAVVDAAMVVKTMATIGAPRRLPAAKAAAVAPAAAAVKPAVSAPAAVAPVATATAVAAASAAPAKAGPARVEKVVPVASPAKVARPKGKAKGKKA